MSVYAKLNEAREKFHASKIKKTGRNTFAGYDYFELGDFIVPALQIFKEVGLIGIISFGQDKATLTISDTKADANGHHASIVIESPMSEANLKGCHPVQNLGAVQTYIRRYLWVAALEIVEHDALDMTTGKDRPKHTPTNGAVIEEHRKSILTDVATAMRDKFSADDVIGAYEEYIGVTDAEEKTYLWGLLKPDSQLRSAIKKYGETLKGE